MSAPFCTLCGNTNPDELGKVIGICLDKDACHQRQYRNARREGYDEGKTDALDAARARLIGQEVIKAAQAAVKSELEDWPDARQTSWNIAAAALRAAADLLDGGA